MTWVHLTVGAFNIQGGTTDSKSFSLHSDAYIVGASFR